MLILGENFIISLPIKVCSVSCFTEEYSTNMYSIYTSRFALHF